MSAKLRLLSVAAAMLVATPALAADRATIDCISTGLDAPTRAAFLADLERNIAHTDQPQTYSEVTTSGLRPVVKACQTRFKWTDDEAQAATFYSFYSMGWPVAQRQAAAKGLVIAKLEQDFATLSEAERTGGVNEAMMQKVATVAEKAGHIRAENSSLAGAVLAMMAIRESSLKNFSGH